MELESTPKLAFLRLPNTSWPSRPILNIAEPTKLITVLNRRQAFCTARTDRIKIDKNNSIKLTTKFSYAFPVVFQWTDYIVEYDLFTK